MSDIPKENMKSELGEVSALIN
ncbi:hypothetical protein LMANV2_90158 [Leptospira interrogans serovar Manilae]|uniref:Uncharacterized protein n=1 Tax=Leptospira interrogans serovar Manilae TaxID=214675 RepID=A0AAQ1P336_LEPIR|nr:hypothetical protein LMANV2_90158 [Leptospira interrogans serovar Manilae]